MKGTGTWTVQTALDLGIPVSGIAEAVFARGLSSSTEQRAAAVGVLPAPEKSWQVKDRDTFVEDVRRALYASKIVAYAQGFDEIAAGAAEYGWNIDRGASPASGAAAASSGPGSSTGSPSPTTPPPRYRARCCSRPHFAEAVGAGAGVVAAGGGRRARVGVPTPGFSSALAYYDGLRPSACRPR